MFKTNDTIVCIKNFEYSNILTINKEYKILSMGIFNTDNIYVTCDININYFVPKSCFASKKELRK